MPEVLPEILPRKQKMKVLKLEKLRVRYETLADSSLIAVDELCKHIMSAPGPRLIVLNTVQNAAVVAQFMKKHYPHGVFHLSTALTPADRARIFTKVESKLKQASDNNWSLVATSCVESGVNFSFRTGFRERFSVSSILQIGGRVNRNSEFSAEGGGVVYSFALKGDDTTQHPAAKAGANILRRALEDNSLNCIAPSDAATRAMKEEIDELGGLGNDLLGQAESARDYPAVQKNGRVIIADTHLVVVDPKLKELLKNRERVDFRKLLNGSVQLWTTKIKNLGMEPFSHLPEIYQWNDDYDPSFLGIMKGVLNSKSYMKGGGVI